MASPVKEYIPKKFKSLKQLDRHRKLCLGLPVPILRKDLPWGYERDPNNSEQALPVDRALLCLYQAKKYLKDSSYVDVSSWVTSCGFKISSYGLFKLITDRPPFDEMVSSDGTILPLEERMKL